tara:strand:+ start:1137 stop:1388 length:252 start_codon:yes stop_codon:yes gene_type:complete
MLSLASDTYQASWPRLRSCYQSQLARLLFCLGLHRSTEKSDAVGSSEDGGPGQKPSDKKIDFKRCDHPYRAYGSVCVICGDVR